jgi:hypothetical protein
MENKTRIELGSVDDLKKRVNDTVGSNLNCAVVKDEKLPSGEFNVSKLATTEFLNIARKHLFDGNFAVVTAEDMNKSQISNSSSTSNTKTTSSKKKM